LRGWLRWYTPHGQRGASFFNVPGTSPPSDSATYYYPNDLSARFVWYHDHAMGLTRTNVYSGIASGFLVTDDLETRLIQKGTLPDLGTPLVIQDKGFWPRFGLVAVDYRTMKRTVRPSAWRYKELIEKKIL